MITCPTKDLKSELLAKKIFTEKIEILPDAILSSKKLLLSRNEYKIDPNFKNSKKIILSVGRLTKQKNFTYLIDEFERFSKVNNDYCLYIIGEGEERKNLEFKINKK